MSRSYLSPNLVKPPLVTGACGLQTRHRDGNLFYFVKVQTQRKEYQIFWLVSNVFRLTNYIGNCCQFPTLPTFLTWVHLRKCLSGGWKMSDGLLWNAWSVFGRCLPWGMSVFFCFFWGVVEYCYNYQIWGPVYIFQYNSQALLLLGSQCFLGCWCKGIPCLKQAHKAR